jgi:hypothetical protein
MSKPSPLPDYRSSAEDTFQGILDGLSRLLFWGGALGTVIGIGFLLFTYSNFSSGTGPAPEAQALNNIAIFSKVLLAGVLALGVATSIVWWGEETLAVLQLGFAAALYFAPLYLPSIFGGQESRISQEVLGSFQTTGMILGLLGMIVLVADVATRVKTRAREGARADQLKYGKGVKEERDIQNVFLGKCWQLPFCRKFVRERCPIYHAKRTCWKERTGCMCEEQVIRNAMENKPIPKDMVAAAAYIPHNNKLTENQKAERCRQCVIYNEHQKHKYRAVLPMAIVVFVGFYLLFRNQLLAATGGVITSLDKIVAGATYGKAGAIRGGVFDEILLAAFMIVAFAYVMKTLEYLIFKAKI